MNYMNRMVILSMSFVLVGTNQRPFICFPCFYVVTIIKFTERPKRFDKRINVLSRKFKSEHKRIKKKKTNNFKIEHFNKSPLSDFRQHADSVIKCIIPRTIYRCNKIIEAKKEWDRPLFIAMINCLRTMHFWEF